MSRLSTIVKVVHYLDAKQKTRLILLTLFIAFTNILDVLAIGLIAVLGQIAISGFGVNGLGLIPTRIIDILGVQNTSLQFKVSVISMLIAFLLLSKTILGVFLSWNMLRDLSRYSASLSQKLCRDYFNQPFLEIIKKSPQEVNFTLGYGVNSLLLNVLGNFCLLLGDLFLLIVLMALSLAIDINFTIIAFAIFLVTGLVVNRIISRRARQIGVEQAKLLIQSDKSIVGLISAYKDYFTKNLINSQVDRINQTRGEISRKNAIVSFLPQLSKYVIEIILVFTVVIMGSIAFAFNDAIHAVPILLVFFAVVSRIAPAVIRIQQQVLIIKSNLGYSQSTLAILDSMQGIAPISRMHKNSGISGSLTKISCEKMTFKYPGNSSDHQTVNSFSFEFTKGKSYAITGPSGSGKSTLINMIIGLIPPDSGGVTIFGSPPNELLASYPGAIGIVPQQIFLIDGTLRENIVLDSSRITVDDEEVIRVLNLVKLGSWFASLQDGLETRISNLNSLLSGGQVQRLGIARSLITHPEILILDESTSALDQQTEFDINKMLFELNPKLTILAIAHRPTTLQLFEEIIYMENGRLRASGNFAEIEHLLKVV